MHRFFVPQGTIRDTVRLTGGTAEQIRRVLRMHPGDHFVLFDGSGSEYAVRLVEFGKDEVRAEVVERRAGLAEPGRAVTLYLSLLNKQDKFEWALQKCTELGISAIVPVLAERSVGALPGPGKQERWERIILEAVEQSGRTRIPELASARALKDALDEESERLENVAGGTHLALMPAVGAEQSLKQALQWSSDQPGSVSMFIGPEGGFTEEELDAAAEGGIIPVSLGPRTLRSETAAVAAVSTVLYELGEME